MKQYEEQVADLQLTVERLQLDKPDVAKLLAEIESGRVGASRAVQQNQELKSQLEEMQRAFVQIVSEACTCIPFLGFNESNVSSPLFFSRATTS